MTACTNGLAALAPRDPKTLTFQFARALLVKDFGAAEKVLDAARKASLPPQAVELMRAKLTSELARRPLWRRVADESRNIALIGLGLLALLWAADLVRKRGRDGASDIAV